ncbi:uncharacterized protein [Musca autumnalis]|uniref:uncharacterized protein n=1 Tax=Musca autumnalis TaxID=221902 RepID=UPI003CEB5066
MRVQQIETKMMVLQQPEKHFVSSSKMSLLCGSDDINDALVNHHILSKMSEFQERDSGWALAKILKLDINTNKAKITRGSLYIKTPNSLSKKNACLNIRNNDEFCFKFAVVAALGKPAMGDETNPEAYNINVRLEVITLQSGMIVDFRGLSFPMALKSIKIFEANNENISVNVFGYEKKKIARPYYLTRKEKCHHINLILLHEVDKYHYIWIKDFSRLIRSQLTNHHGAIYFCNGCVQHFTVKAVCDKHKEECGGVVSEVPEPGNNILKFKDYD